MSDLRSELDADTQKDLASLDEEDASLETHQANDEVVYSRINATLDRVIKALGNKMADPGLKDKRPEIQDIIGGVRAKQSRFLKHFAPLVEKNKKQREREKFATEESAVFTDLDTRTYIPAEERALFQRHYRTLPEKQRPAYLTRLKAALKVQKREGGTKQDDVYSLCQFRGVLFELSRRAMLIEDGGEEMSEKIEPLKVEYFGYDPKADDPKLNLPPTQRLGNNSKGDIEIDVQGIVRNGKPYVFETKAYPRKMLGFEYEKGDTAKIRNQLLKYNAAVEKGIIAGATLELRGRIDYNLLRWAVGEAVQDQGAIPFVEIIYNITLPSGNEYRFVLKRCEGKGLQFENDDSAYTREDRLIIAGLAQAVRDKSITNLIQTTNIDEGDLPTGLTPEDVEHPENITDIDKFRLYEEERMGNIWHKLSSKGLEAERSTRVAPDDPRVTPGYVMHELRAFQDLLNANPDLKALKWAYVIGEDRYEEVVAKIMEAVETIRSFENARKNGEGRRTERERQRDRIAKGYSGPPHGFALDVEHIMADVLQDMNKTRPGQKPRSYNDVGRFHNLRDLPRHLAEQDRTYLEIVAFDPAKDKHNSLIVKGDRVAEKDDLVANFERNITIENFKRARLRFQELQKRHDFLNKKGHQNLDASEKAEFAKVQSRLSTYLQNRTLHVELKTAEASLEALQRARDEQIGEINQRKSLATQGLRGAEAKKAQEPFFAEIRGASAECAEKSLVHQEQLLGIYKQIFSKEWDSFAIREISRQEANIIKFMYIIGAAGNVILDEEQIRGADDSSRAAHSELAQGRNIYSAGELTFAKQKDGTWKLTEINNGSGHYRPEHTTLPYAKNVICETLNIDPEDPAIKTRHCIFRGIDIDGVALV